jgi:hypothetical protein
VKQQSHCLITTHAAGPCQQCGKYQHDGMHLCDDKALCQNCCPEHGANHEWDEVASVVNGEQMDLSVLLEDHD